MIEPDILEECVLSCVLKHLSLNETVRHLTTHEQSDSAEYNLLREVMSETYRRLYAMIRQLQVSGALQKLP